MNRREFLKLSAASAGGLVLAGRAQAAALAPEKAPSVVRSFREAPELARAAQAAALPPVEQRLPANPLVLTPVEGIGVYGGRMRVVEGWISAAWELMYGHSPLRWVNDGLGLAPGIFDTWSANANSTVWEFHLREGLKWSDGQPCTVDDILFWWQDLVGANYPDAPDEVPDFAYTAGSLASFEKVDAYRLKITYIEPSPLAARQLANWVNGCTGPRVIAPKHYLSQFHPKYNAGASFETLIEKADAFANPDLPTLNAWMAETIVPDVSVTFQRNPYYYGVDPDGNQLPYLDGIDYKIDGNWENQMADAAAGKVDFSCFHAFTLSDLTALEAGRAAGNYEINLLDSGSGTGIAFYWNYDVRDDKLRQVYRTPKFKQALSLALNRPAIQQSVYAGKGFQTTGTLNPKAVEFNFSNEARQRFMKYRDAYVAYDPAGANALLDEIGMTRGAGNLRTYKDGTPFVLTVDLPSDAGNEARDVLAIAVANWKAVGFNVVVNEVLPEDYHELWRRGELGFRAGWEVGDGPDHLVYPSWLVPNETSRWAPLAGQMMAMEYTPPDGDACALNPWDREPPRYCSADPQYAGTPVETLHKLYRQARAITDRIQRYEKAWEMVEVHYANIFFLGTVANYPRIVIVSKNLDNVPSRDQLALGGNVNPWIVPFPAVTNPETYSYGLARPFAADNLSGGPGSVFTIKGSNFMPDSVVSVTVNGQPLDEVMTDTNGKIIFALDFGFASPGRYVIVMTQVEATLGAAAQAAAGKSITVVIEIVASLPPRPPDLDIDPIPVPPNSVRFQTYLPVLKR